MQTLQSHHADHPEFSHLDAPKPQSRGSRFTLGSVSLTFALLAIAICFIPAIAPAALPMSLIALVIGLLDVRNTLQNRDARIGIALIACILSLAAFVMSVDAASTVRRLTDPTQPETPRPLQEPGSQTQTP